MAFLIVLISNNGILRATLSLVIVAKTLVISPNLLAYTPHKTEIVENVEFRIVEFNKAILKVSEIIASIDLPRNAICS